MYIKIIINEMNDMNDISNYLNLHLELKIV